MFVDDTLSQRIFEQNREFFSGLALAAARSGLDVEPCYLDTGSTIAFFGGPGNPLSQANGAFTPEDIGSVSAFYSGRAPEWEALLTPFAHSDAHDRLCKIGAESSGWESVLVRDPADPLPNWDCPSEIRFERIQPDQIDLWLDVSCRSFFGSERSEGVDMMNRLMRNADNIYGYLGYWNGEVAAAASITPGLDCRVDFLGGMGTFPEYRGRGLQMAAIRRRLQELSPDVEIVTMGAKPGSPSHRNAERAGFRVAYSQLSLRVPVR